MGIWPPPIQPTSEMVWCAAAVGRGGGRAPVGQADGAVDDVVSRDSASVVARRTIVKCQFSSMDIELGVITSQQRGPLN